MSGEADAAGVDARVSLEEVCQAACSPTPGRERAPVRRAAPASPVAQADEIVGQVGAVVRLQACRVHLEECPPTGGTWLQIGRRHAFLHPGQLDDEGHALRVVRHIEAGMDDRLVAEGWMARRVDASLDDVGTVARESLDRPCVRLCPLDVQAVGRGRAQSPYGLFAQGLPLGTGTLPPVVRCQHRPSGGVGQWVNRGIAPLAEGTLVVVHPEAEGRTCHLVAQRVAGAVVRVAPPEPGPAFARVGRVDMGGACRVVVDRGEVGQADAQLL